MAGGWAKSRREWASLVWGGRGWGKPHPYSCFVSGWAAAEEIDEEIGNASGLFVLEPVRGVGEGKEFGGVAVAEAVVGHFEKEESVALAPKDSRGDVDRRIGIFSAITEGGAVPVDHAGERAGLRPRGAVLGEIFGGEGAHAAGADE